MFDEIFYARNGCWYVIGTEEACQITDLASRVHPPLGNWIIGMGIAVFGYEPFGWRVTAALAGTITVALTYLLARRLLVSAGTRAAAASVGAFAAAALLAIDFLHLVQSRVAMLDVFIVLFVVGAVLAIVLDRDRPPVSDPPTLLERLTLGRPWRLVAGACLGAAAAIKWSGPYVGLAIVGLTIAWEIAVTHSARPEWSWARAAWIAFRREALPTIALLGFVPLLVYVASYTGRMPGQLLALPWDGASVWRGIWEHQSAMLDFHTQLAGHHPYESPPWSWPLLKRPVAYYFAPDAGAYRHILALGNPLVWWPGLLGLIGLAVIWVRRGASVWGPELVVLGAALATYLPWLVLSGSRSQVFLWYLLPAIPFLCIGLGILAALAWERLAGRVIVGVAALVVLASAAFYFPLLTALPVSPDAWWPHIAFRDCERPDGPTLELPDDTISQGEPPEGWCWI